MIWMSGRSPEDLDSVGTISIPIHQRCQFPVLNEVKRRDEELVH